MSDRFPIYISQHNHFDPLWHRCWDRSFDFRGQRFRSYADVEEHVINIWLENAKREVGFVEGQSVVFRKYLERNPHRLGEMQKLVKEGLIQLLAGGETVSDTNMPSGETLLRNLVLGQRYFEDVFGVVPTVGTLEDAFGHSAQIPQLFRGIGCRMVAGISRIRVPGEYWKGLDGSVVFTGSYPHGRHVGHCEKIPPCPQCKGYGCDACGNRGLADKCGITDESIWEALQARYPNPFGIVHLGGEETVPNPRLPDLIARAEKELGVDIRANELPVVEEYFSGALARVDDADLDVSDQVESNPVFAGCYVSRIRVKQEMRRVENLVNTAERWATIAHLMGQDYPAEEMLEAWRNTVFVGFHDAITSSHMDQPYYELLDMLAEAECEADCVLESSFERIESEIALDPDKQYLIVYNSESWDRNEPVTVTIGNSQGAPILRASGSEVEILDVSATGTDVDVTFRASVPSLGYVVLEAEPDSTPLHSGVITSGPGSVENEFFRIRVSDRGIDSIVDKRSGKEILDTGAYLANELILEEDVGNPWGTTKPPAFEERLGRYTTGVKIRRAENVSEIMLTGQYKGADEKTQILNWRQSVMIYKGYDRIDFKTEIDWDTAQRRVRIAFPTNIKTDEGVYSIPYGAIRRRAYERDDREDMTINGDWPAVNWVDVYSESENRGVALINTGTPSHKVENGVVFMSVFRSPTDAWVLDEPHYYSCPDFDGARDAGHHEFFYSLIPHPGDYRAASIEKRGREVNNPLICRGLVGSTDGKAKLSHSFLKMDATDNVIVTALKKADRDDSIVVRLAETDGVPGETSLSIERAGRKASIVDLLERNPERVEGKIKLGAFKIVTLRLG